MGSNYEKDIYKQLMEIMERCDSLEKELKSVKATSKSEISSLGNNVKYLTSRCSKLEKQNDEFLQQVVSFQSNNASLLKENASLKEENFRLNCIINNNSNNTSLPPSTNQKPSKEKKANEYNAREKTGKKSGGQTGHAGATLTRSNVEEKIQSGSFQHRIENWIDGAPSTKKLSGTDYQSRYVIDLEIRSVAKELRFYANADGNFHIPSQYKSDVTYGTTVKTLAVDLYSEGNVSLTRIQSLIRSISEQAISISEGSIYGFLNSFASLGDLSLKQIETTLLQAKAICTDATFVSTNGVQSYIRNLSTDEVVRYYAMRSKSIEAMKLIHILCVFQGILIHDHETGLYHFGSDHGECNVHILRYLRKNTEDTGNTWSPELSRLLTKANERLKELSAKEEFFTDAETTQIVKEYEKLLTDGYMQNEKTLHKYAKENELTLLNRLTKYKHNHLLFLSDQNVKFHNNMSEQDLRKCKTHQKMTGGFRKESGSKLYCDIMSIVETCKKKHMQLFESIRSIFEGRRAIY